VWRVSPTRERKGPKPKPEIRSPKEGRNPKPEMIERGFGLRCSAFFRVSAFGIRIWAAGGGRFCPDTSGAGGAGERAGGEEALKCETPQILVTLAALRRSISQTRRFRDVLPRGGWIALGNRAAEGRKNLQTSLQHARNMLGTCLQHACNHGGTLALVWLYSGVASVGCQGRRGPERHLEGHWTFSKKQSSSGGTASESRAGPAYWLPSKPFHFPLGRITSRRRAPWSRTGATRNRSPNRN
jgi:hypothetical protein